MHCDHECLSFKGGKFSKSRGATVEAPYFLTKYDPDALHLYLARKAPWFQIEEDQAAAATRVYVILRAADSLNTILAPISGCCRRSAMEHDRNPAGDRAPSFSCRPTS